ncbi:MAG: methylmalonyl-CoA carboxyltransferase, partial [Deltaproteobacteria bacterium]|nr:methylmalonyl-CoA carboxyltransferase [Deltaproteobacteria bacterium]
GLFRKEIMADGEAAKAKGEDPAKAEAEERARREKEFADTYMSVYYPAKLQHIDDIIDPKETRPILIKSLEQLANKVKELPWRKHGNIPL